MHPKFLRSSIAVSMSLALTVVQVPMPLRAQSAEDAVSGAISSAVASDLQSIDARLARLEEQMTDLKDRNLALEAALATTTSALKDEIAGQVTDLKTKADEAAKEASNKVKDALEGMAENTIGGDWVAGKSPQEILDGIAKSKAAFTALQQQVDAARSTLNTSLSDNCPNETPADTAGLARLYPESVPNKWTSEIVFRAKSNGLTLPDCVAGLKDEAGNPLADQYYKDQLAAQQSAAAMNSMMMMALSTGNPYIIAAAMVLMVLLANFSDSGSGGGGEGGEKGSGKGPSTGDTSGETAATDGSDGENPAASDGSGDGAGGQSSDGSYANVAPGAGAKAFINGQEITVKSTKGDGFSWTFGWGPPKIYANDNPMTLPPFNTMMQIMSADLKADANQSSIVVKIIGPNDPSCVIDFTIHPDPQRHFEIVADTSQDASCL